VYGLPSTGCSRALSRRHRGAHAAAVVLVEEVAVVLRALVLVLLWVVLPVPPAAADSGPWGWPLAGPREVARGFDPPASRYGTGHRGADLPSGAGAAVRASAAGRVSYAGLLAGRGVVVVTHGALRTTYEPVVASVRVGQSVPLGAVVGVLAAGHAGCPAAACLHWGLRRGEEYLDPVRLVERGPVRLLPLSGAGPAAPAAPAAPAPAGRASSSRVLAPARPVQEPSWSVRAAEAPLGAAALVALVVGIGLLARPRPQPPAPSGGVSSVAAPALAAAPSEPGVLLDLDAARARRQAAS
jgi:hypothetical protein